MKISHRFLACAALAAFPLLSAADTTVGLANSNASDKFRSILQESIATYAKTKPGVTVTAEDAKDDPAKQLAQVKAMADKKVGVLIVMPVNVVAAPVIEATRQAGVPVVYLNVRPSEPLGEGSVYVGSDETMAGRIQGDLMAKKLGGKGTIFILKGPSDHNGAIGRTKGLKAVIAGHPDMKVSGEAIGNWSRAEAQRIVADLVKKGDLPSAIVANNDEMALGAIDALSAGGAAGKVLVMGVDATPDAMKAVKEGKLTATVLQNAKGQGRAALDLALKMAAKESVPKELMVPFELVVSENIDKYMAK
ncbi:substrate-binding domain-containing protein [Ideonella sp. DXS29W]|uniref:Substrate-binding domain-containing protein n=1 Tax=Ideonella lacteola TaxID=2984193 RepID=A0ABU9BJ49_9BURK